MYERQQKNRELYKNDIEYKNAENPTDLTGNRRQHILAGDSKGGGHRAGAGKSGKTEFPTDWTDNKIINDISDVATDPKSQHGVNPEFYNAPYAIGTRGGVEIRVDVFPSNSRKSGEISTGYRTNTEANPGDL